MNNKLCDKMFCRMERDINEDPMYILGASLFYGFLFSTWSWGILYLILFLVIWEIGYYIFCRYTNKMLTYYPCIRFGIVCGSIMGFLIGRNITEMEDHEESAIELCDKIRKFFK